MMHADIIEDLPIKIGGIQCVIPIIWATDQPSHDMIIGNNFQRLYSPCTQTIDQIIFTINGHSVPVLKLAKAYTHKAMEFTRSQRGERVTPTQREIALRITESNLGIKEEIMEQQEKLCEKLYSTNPLEHWNKDKAFAKITLSDPTKIIRVRQMIHTYQDILEFDEQIKELLKKKLIRSSNSPHNSPAFMVRNHSEEKRGNIRAAREIV